MLESYERVLSLAPSLDHVIPGHDPLVLQLYPAPRLELEGVIARLDAQPKGLPSVKPRR